MPDGEKILADELRKRGFDPKEYMDKKKLENVYKEFRVFNYTDLMYGIAVKSINPTSVCEKLTNQNAPSSRRRGTVQLNFAKSTSKRISRPVWSSRASNR